MEVKQSIAVDSHPLSPGEQGCLNRLPEDQVIHVASYLTPRELSHCAIAWKEFSSFSMEHIWQDLTSKKFPACYSDLVYRRGGSTGFKRSSRDRNMLQNWRHVYRDVLSGALRCRVQVYISISMCVCLSL